MVVILKTNLFPHTKSKLPTLRRKKIRSNLNNYTLELDIPIDSSDHQPATDDRQPLFQK